MKLVNSVLCFPVQCFEWTSITWEREARTVERRPRIEEVQREFRHTTVMQLEDRNEVERRCKQSHREDEYLTGLLSGYCWLERVWINFPGAYRRLGIESWKISLFVEHCVEHSGQSHHRSWARTNFSINPDLPAPMSHQGKTLNHHTASMWLNCTQKES